MPELTDDGRPQSLTAVLVVPPPVVLDGGPEFFKRGCPEARSGGQSQDAVHVRPRDRGGCLWCWVRRLWCLALGGHEGLGCLPGTAGKPEHVSWDAQAVRDAFDDVHVQQLASPGDHFADSAGCQFASSGDHRRIDARPYLHQPEDSAEVPYPARMDHLGIGEQPGRQFLRPVGVGHRASSHTARANWKATRSLAGLPVCMLPRLTIH